MDDQLPTPLGELIFFHLYLGSITSVLFISLMGIFLKRRKLFTWKRFVLLSVGYYIFSSTISFFLWLSWPFKADIMFGFIYLPMLVVSVMIIMFTFKFVIAVLIQRE